MLLFVISISFVFIYALLLFYYYTGWQSVPVFEAITEKKYSFISVIVPARNEEKTISSLLDGLKAQTYPAGFFEVIIVDDFSTDKTATIVKSYSAPNFFLIQPENKNDPSKKKAIEAGIKKANGELIITTDADCIVLPSWLQIMNAFYLQNEAGFIAAPVKFEHDNSLFQIFQVIDFLTLQGVTAASVYKNFHTMCNGANLAYQKEKFKEVNGFEGIDKVASGDDMLLMHKIWKTNTGKVFYLKSKSVIVTTQPMNSFKDFIMQRKRWASKTFVYEDYRIIFVLAFIYLFNCLFIALVIASFVNSFYWWYVIALLLAKTIVEFPFVYSVARFYNQQKLLRYFFLFQPFHIFYTVSIGIISQLGWYEWKGRRVK